MQDEVTQKIVTLAFNGIRPTPRLLANAMLKTLRTMDRVGRKTAEKIMDTQGSAGRVRIGKLAGSGAGLANIEITDKNIRDFEKTARKYGVSYALKKDRSSSRYFVIFKARDINLVKAAFREYTGRQLKAQKNPAKNPSVLGRLSKLAAMSKGQEPPERQKPLDKER